MAALVSHFSKIKIHYRKLGRENFQKVDFLKEEIIKFQGIFSGVCGRLGTYKDIFC